MRIMYLQPSFEIPECKSAFMVTLSDVEMDCNLLQSMRIGIRCRFRTITRLPCVWKVGGGHCMCSSIESGVGYSETERDAIVTDAAFSPT